ncbi:hypothetical protein [Paraburkholderia sp. 40]|uniref:hypothetical protein n=1 Tax=Paraburkholderia sp. 40 TaxID=2991059 RepID=UPI003D1E91DB
MVKNPTFEETLAAERLAREYGDAKAYLLGLAVLVVLFAGFAAYVGDWHAFVGLWAASLAGWAAPLWADKAWRARQTMRAYRQWERERNGVHD